VQRNDHWSSGAPPRKSMCHCGGVCECVCVCVSASFEFCVLSIRGLYDRRINDPEECVCVCVCVSLIATIRNNNSQQRYLVTGRGQTKKERIIYKQLKTS
jgi:hypothetical protein